VYPCAHTDAASLEADAYTRQTAGAVITTLVYPGHDSLKIGGGFVVPHRGTAGDVIHRGCVYAWEPHELLLDAERTQRRQQPFDFDRHGFHEVTSVRG
jgi:hypothetical protein